MAAPKGHKKAGGRRPGTPNKTTTAVKAALVEAFDGLGGTAALIEWGKLNPGEFYKLWAKLLPTEIKNADGEAFRVAVVEEIVSANDSEDHSPAPGPAPLPAQ
jgi:hypothetical protein